MASVAVPSISVAQTLRIINVTQGIAFEVKRVQFSTLGGVYTGVVFEINGNIPGTISRSGEGSIQYRVETTHLVPSTTGQYSCTYYKWGVTSQPEPCELRVGSR